MLGPRGTFVALGGAVGCLAIIVLQLYGVVTAPLNGVTTFACGLCAASVIAAVRFGAPSAQICAGTAWGCAVATLLLALSGDMGLLNVFVASSVVCASSAVGCAPTPVGGWRQGFAVMCGAVSCAIGIVMVVAQSSGMPPIGEQLNPSALPIGGAVIALAISVIALASRVRDTAPSILAGWWFPLPLAMIAGVVSAVMLAGVLSEQHAAHRRELATESIYIADHLTSAWNVHTAALARLKARWEAERGLSLKAWKSEVRQYRQTAPEVQAVLWVDASAQVRRVMPKSQRKMFLDLHVDEFPQQRSVLNATQYQNRVTVTCNVALPQRETERAIFIVAPVFMQDTLHGYIISILAQQPFFQQVLHGSIQRGYAIAIEQDGVEIYQHGPTDSGREYTVRHALKFRNLLGVIHTWPTPEWLQQHQTNTTRALATILSICFVILVLAMILLYRARQQERREQHAAAEARHGYERLHLALEMLGGGLREWNVPSGEMFFSAQWWDMLGFEPRDMPPHVRTWEELIHPDDRPHVQDALDAHLEGRARVYKCTCRIRTESGAYRHVLEQGKVVARTADGAPERVVVLATDVTADVELRQQLQAAQGAANAANSYRHDFFAKATHELRTPLNIIIGYMEVLGDTDIDEEQREYAERSSQKAQELLELIHNLLDLSQISAGNLYFEPQVIHVHTLVEEVVHVFLPQAQKKELQLGWQMAYGIPEQLIGDPRRIRQVLANLVGNAVKFTEKGYIMIDVTLAAEGAETVEICFSVTDTGPGMSKEQQERLFQAFVQGDYERFEGGGMGLAVCRALVERMGGKITVRSEPNKGSTLWFTVLLLRADTEEPAQIPPDRV